MGTWKKRVSEQFRSEIKDIKTLQFWRAVCAEMIGTFILLATGLLLTVALADCPKYVTTLGVAVGMGFCVYCIMASIGHVSGAHINPAVSLALLISMQFTPLKALIYVVAQCTGAVLGSWLPKALVPPGRQISGYVRHHHEVTLAQAFGIEVFNTFFVVFIALGSIDTHYHPYDPSWGLPIGLSVTIAIVTGADLSGTMLNPCISFGRSFIAGEWEHSWLYWVGPITGACLATFIYHYIVRQGGTPIQRKDSGILGEDTGSNKEHHHGNWVADEFISRHACSKCKTLHHKMSSSALFTIPEKNDVNEEERLTSM
ncbi:aquaporin AQPAe.a-like [Lingula anatina]|uniref:Aquaporin AQPAe.a-like n=1 Tax=Lingula anatina TaxID=7574 RepID=A0A1S3JLL5_LINAN|nr:aquaporin AQPAe.a-like [Lingula anatina]|eukprot:XP_013411273.1 aquaporin AQPAe.a-like [Lingula anatina]